MLLIEPKLFPLNETISWKIKKAMGDSIRMDDEYERGRWIRLSFVSNDGLWN
jgi:hypothetical protein